MHPDDFAAAINDSVLTIVSGCYKCYLSIQFMDKVFDIVCMEIFDVQLGQHWIQIEMQFIIFDPVGATIQFVSETTSEDFMCFCRGSTSSF